MSTPRKRYARALAALAAGSLTLTLAVTATGPAALADEAPPNDRAPREPVVPDEPEVPEDPEPPNRPSRLPWETKASKDVQGYRHSTYTGKYFAPNREQYRVCVVQRESGGNYDEPTGSFTGAYQMTYSLSQGAISTMLPEIRSTYGSEGVEALESLRGVPIHRWPRFWQDAAFWTIFNFGAGWRHWSAEWGANWNCNHSPGAESGWPSPAKYWYSPIVGKMRGADWAWTGYGVDPQRRDGAGDQRRGHPRELGNSPHSFGTPNYSRWVARRYMRVEYGWGKREWRALNQMWWKESNWRYDVVNWQGPWRGLGQVNEPYILGRGYSISEYMASPYIQVVVGTAYIKGRYGTPRSAWAFWQNNNWY